MKALLPQRSVPTPQRPPAPRPSPSGSRRRLQVEVVEGQMDAAARFGDDQPDAVEVVAVTLGIVGDRTVPMAAVKLDIQGTKRGRRC